MTWAPLPLKRVASINERNLSENTDADYRFRYVDVAAVSEGEVSVPEEDTTFATAPSRARRIAAPGDVLVSTVRTYLRAVAAVPAADRLIFSTGLAVLSARPGTDPRFLSYACRSDEFLQQVEARSTGVSYPAISPSELGDVPVPLPPIEEQRRIADFLEEQTIRMDTAIDRRKRQQRLVELRPWSYFMNAVASSEASHLRLGRVIYSLVDGPFGSTFTSADYTSAGAAVVRLGNIKFGEYSAENQAFVGLELYRRLRQHAVQAGDLLIAGLGDARNHAGRACVAPDRLGPCLVKGKCFRARVLVSRADPQYLAYLLSSNSGRAVFDLASRGSTRSMLNLELVADARIPIPSVEVQSVLASRMQRDVYSARLLADKIRLGVQKLAERRASLITAAVMGQFDVTTARKVA